MLSYSSSPFSAASANPNKKCKLHLSLLTNVKIFCSFSSISLKPSIIIFAISVFYCSNKSSTQSFTLGLSVIVFLRFNNILGSWSLREKCPNKEFFLVRIQSKCGKIRTRRNSVFGHCFSRSGSVFLTLIRCSVVFSKLFFYWIKQSLSAAPTSSSKSPTV